jgi:hypothetical protein
MLLTLVDRGLSLTEIYKLSIRQVMFLSRVNNRLKEIDTISEMQTLIAANGRQMGEMDFTSFTNRLRYG